MERAGSKRGRGTPIPKGRAKKPRAGDGVAESAGDGVAESAAPTSPRKLEPTTACQKVKEPVKELKELEPACQKVKEPVKELKEKASTAGDQGGDQELEPACQEVKEPLKEKASTDGDQVQKASTDGTDGDQGGDQVHHRPMVPHTMDSEKGVATVLTRKQDREITELYTVKKSTPTKQSKASRSSASSTSSQDSISSSKQQKFRKLTPRDLDELSQKTKKVSQDLRKEEGMQRWKGQQLRQQLLRQQEQQQEQPGSIESRMKDFLESFVQPGTTPIFYKKKVEFMRDLGSWELEVDFTHIFFHDFELALDIANYSSHEKLQAAAREFIKMHVSDEDKQAAVWSASVKFISMPDSLVPATELLKDPDTLVDVYINGCNLSTVSAAFLGGFSEHILDTHALGRTWDGDYDLSDMCVLNKSQFVIKKRSFILEDDQSVQFLSKKADMNRLTELFTPCVDRRNPEGKKNGEPPKASDLPLFYMQFCNDIQDVAIDEINKPVFRAYLLNSPALKMPQARHDLVCASHLALKRPVSAAVHRLVLENPWPGQDWRKSVSMSTCEVLREVYFYKGNDDGEQAASGPSSGLEQASLEPSPRFPMNIKGIITYDRNFKNHGSKKRLFGSIAEVEVFASTNLFEYLPIFLKRLFYMEHSELMNDFADILTQYIYARVRTTDGSEVKAAPQLSFWEQKD